MLTICSQIISLLMDGWGKFVTYTWHHEASVGSLGSNYNLSHARYTIFFVTPRRANDITNQRIGHWLHSSWYMCLWEPWDNLQNVGVAMIYSGILLYWWTRQIIHDTLIMVEPRLESYCPTFVTVIDQPYQSITDNRIVSSLRPSDAYMRR